jgi:pantothenate kinase
MTGSGTQPAPGPPVVDASVVDLVARARALVTPGRRTILGIVGAPGAGKSTLAAALESGLAGRAVTVGMDGFHLAQAELERLGRQARKGAPDTFDPAGYAALLRRLRENTDPVVYAPLFDRGLEEPVGSSVPVGPDIPLVLTEGNYLLLEGHGWAGVRQYLDQVWYLDVPDDLRRGRLIERHVRFGRSPAEATLRATTGSDEHNARTVHATRARADLIVKLRRS